MLTLSGIELTKVPMYYGDIWICTFRLKIKRICVYVAENYPR